MRVAMPYGLSIGALGLGALVITAGAGCSSAKTVDPAGGTSDVPTTSADGPSFTMKATIKAGTETHQCQYVTMPAADGFVVGGKHSYTPGSHHMLLFTTDLASIPAGQDGLRDCYEAGGSMMSHIRGLLYGAQTPTGETKMPDGVGLPYKAGGVLLFQSHYLNAGAADIDAEVDVHLSSVADGIANRAGVLFYYDPFIHVPAGGTARAAMRCKIRQDITLIGAGSHFHKRGVDYAAYVDPPSGSAASTPFYTSTDWDHPSTLSASMTIKAGSHVRFGCGYDNAKGTSEYFQGQSAEDNEMCMFIGTYYPEMTQADDFCEEADGFGTGAKACADTSACIQSCPASAMPKGSLENTSGAMDPCWQKCFVDSCASASTPLIAQLQCVGKTCSAECAADATKCETCAITNCGSQVSACQAHTCAQ